MMYDIIIIGGGPAGLTAGLYTSRAGMKTILIEKIAPGGQVASTEKVENYPGFPEGINGYELTKLMLTQAKKFGMEVISGEVTKISGDKEPARSDSRSGGFVVRTKSAEYQALAVIIATGTVARKLGVPGEDKFTGRGISYCATCDAPFFRDKEVVVVGGGDAAVEEALFLTKFAKKVLLVHRRDRLRATKIIQERALANPKMQFVWNSVPDSIVGTDRVEGLRIKNKMSGEMSTIPSAGIFVFIGFIPNTGFLKGFIPLDETGYIITDDEMRTSQKGIYACGDVRKKMLRQIINACGEGATAAFNAQHYVAQMK